MMQATFSDSHDLASLPMMTNPQNTASPLTPSLATSLGTSASSALKQPRVSHRPLSPRTKAIIREAEEIKQLLMQLSWFSPDNADAQKGILEQHEKIKHLNSFGKQLLIRMFRSNDRFWGYKVDFEHYLLKPDVLFLVGTLCDSFDYMNTSPIYGLNVLDIGCGALSTYGPPDESQDLLSQFHADRPPIATEMLQMLGAKTIGLDPRANNPEDYKYDVAYKHFKVEFENVEQWLRTTQQKFDVISCMNLFNRQSFLYDHHSYEDTGEFFKSLRIGLLPDGLLYSSPPLLPSSEENRQMNRRIFTRAGFRILHEGYFFIATKA
jgi:SAM-dependent methyltransferase